MEAYIVRTEITKDKVFDYGKMRNDGLYIVFQFGKNRFEMPKKYFRVNMGHDDSLPFQAILYRNRKPFAKCYNDGWGGPTNIEPIDKANRELYNKIDNELKDYEYIDSKYHYTSKWSIENIVNIIADDMARIA